mgnify:CR=1 FL=1
MEGNHLNIVSAQSIHSKLVHADLVTMNAYHAVRLDALYAKKAYISNLQTDIDITQAHGNVQVGLYCIYCSYRSVEMANFYYEHLTINIGTIQFLC